MIEQGGDISLSFISDFFSLKGKPLPAVLRLELCSLVELA
jgi:hypothetical protein